MRDCRASDAWRPKKGDPNRHEMLASGPSFGMKAPKRVIVRLLCRIIGSGRSPESAGARKLRPKRVKMYDAGVWLC